jgi:hypothetical protein
MKPFEVPPPVDPQSSWALGVDVDLHAALAVSRATALALAAISPQVANALRQALSAEIRVMENASDPLAFAAADAVREVLDEVGAVS